MVCGGLACVEMGLDEWIVCRALTQNMDVRALSKPRDSGCFTGMTE